LVRTRARKYRHQRTLHRAHHKFYQCLKSTGPPIGHPSRENSTKFPPVSSLCHDACDQACSGACTCAVGIICRLDLWAYKCTPAPTLISGPHPAQPQPTLGKGEGACPGACTHSARAYPISIVITAPAIVAFASLCGDVLFYCSAAQGQHQQRGLPAVFRVAARHLESFQAWSSFARESAPGISLTCRVHEIQVAYVCQLRV